MAISYKKSYKNYFGCLLSLALIISVSFLLINSNISNAVTNKGLMLSPLRNELNIAPGTSIRGDLTVTNSTNSEINIDLIAEEFNVINQQYDYKFMPESDLTKWIKFDKNNVDIASGKSAKINYHVGVPLSAEPGGRYISLFASTDTKVDENNINSRQRVAMLLYINVTGDVSREGHLLSLNTPWFIGVQNKWSMTIQNKGTTHFRSRYSVAIKNIFTNNIAVKKSGDALILPGSVRLITDDMLIPKLPGIYKVFYKIGLGDTPSVTEIRYIIFLPIYLIVIFIVLVITIIIVVKRRLNPKS